MEDIVGTGSLLAGHLGNPDTINRKRLGSAKKHHKELKQNDMY